ncbi:MAG: hypothetical protein KF842_08245 [Caulobacter sp.]|nr:hypothetical protein [Caulobacter sp.]
MIFKLFAKQTFLDAEIEAWLLDGYGWLMRNLGGMERISASPLAMPNRDFFPPTKAKGRALGTHIFDCVRSGMGMQDWYVSLEPFKRAPSLAGLSYGTFESGGANGAFEWDGNKVIISYADDLISQPHQLVATFAHELSHYLTGSVSEQMPGGEEAHELLTDLCVAYAGFGVFGANAAFHFQQFSDGQSQGWSSSRSGYLSERSWAFALAVFIALKGLPADSADRWLKDGLVRQVKAASKYLAANPGLLEPLRAIP